MVIHVSALVSRVRALGGTTEEVQRASKLKVFELSFSNDDLKAQVEVLASANKGLEAKTRKAKDELKLKADSLL